MQSEQVKPTFSDAQQDLRIIFPIYHFKKTGQKMPTSMWSKQTFSITRDELSAHTDDEYTTVMGGLIIDLVSAPRTLGTYHIQLTAIMRAMPTFLHAYTKVQVNGETFWGRNQEYRSEKFWQEMRKAFANSTIHVPTTQPVWATASYEEHPVTFRFTINTIMGGAQIYQLDPNSVDSKHASLKYN